VRQEIRICGFGGQVIILAGVILGEAATRSGYQAVQTQSYGPESRGGAARSEVLVSSEPVDYPRVTRADVLVALSQPAYDRYSAEVAPGGVVIVDRDLVKAEVVHALPFQVTAEKVGYKIVANMVMLGYLGALLDFVSDEELENTVLRRIPKGTEDLNRRAVRAGRELFEAGEAGNGQ